MRCDIHDLPLTLDAECEECRIERLRRVRPGRVIEEPSELLSSDYEDGYLIEDEEDLYDDEEDV